jgi:peptidyl-prolyl cis-trans isomerase B (cyclophilin B)
MILVWSLFMLVENPSDPLADLGPACFGIEWRERAAGLRGSHAPLDCTSRGVALLTLQRYEAACSVLRAGLEEGLEAARFPLVHALYAAGHRNAARETMRLLPRTDYLDHFEERMIANAPGRDMYLGLRGLLLTAAPDVRARVLREIASFLEIGGKMSVNDKALDRVLVDKLDFLAHEVTSEMDMEAFVAKTILHAYLLEIGWITWINEESVHNYDEDYPHWIRHLCRFSDGLLHDLEVVSVRGDYAKNEDPIVTVKSGATLVERRLQFMGDWVDREGLLALLNDTVALTRDPRRFRSWDECGDQNKTITFLHGRQYVSLVARHKAAREPPVEKMVNPSECVLVRGNRASLPQAGSVLVNPRVLLETDRGCIELELFEDDARNTVVNFVRLAMSGFYDGLVFNRVVDEFLVQSGDPTGTGRGGPGYYIPDEPNTRSHVEGSLCLAGTSLPNSGGSQFFILRADAPYLDGQQEQGRYPVFGRVVSGMAIVNAIVQGERIVKITILQKRGHPYFPDKLIPK